MFTCLPPASSVALRPVGDLPVDALVVADRVEHFEVGFVVVLEGKIKLVLRPVVALFARLDGLGAPLLDDVREELPESLGHLAAGVFAFGADARLFPARLPSLRGGAGAFACGAGLCALLGFAGGGACGSSLLGLPRLPGACRPPLTRRGALFLLRSATFLRRHASLASARRPPSPFRGACGPSVYVDPKGAGAQGLPSGACRANVAAWHTRRG